MGSAEGACETAKLRRRAKHETRAAFQTALIGSHARYVTQRARYVRYLHSILDRERHRREALQRKLLNVDMAQSDLTIPEAEYAVQALEASVEWLDSEVFAVQAHLLLLLQSHAALQSGLDSLPQGAAARQRCVLLTDLE